MYYSSLFSFQCREYDVKYVFANHITFKLWNVCLFMGEGGYEVKFYASKVVSVGAKTY